MVHRRRRDLRRRYDRHLPDVADVLAADAEIGFSAARQEDLELAVLAGARRELDLVKVQPEIALAVHPQLPDAFDGPGRCDVSQRLVMRELDLAVGGGWQKGRAAQGTVGELVSRFEQRRRPLEVTRRRVCAVHQELQVQPLTPGDHPENRWPWRR